jgi:hypothetical protein
MGVERTEVKQGVEPWGRSPYGYECQRKQGEGRDASSCWFRAACVRCHPSHPPERLRPLPGRCLPVRPASLPPATAGCVRPPRQPSPMRSRASASHCTTSRPPRCYRVSRYIIFPPAARVLSIGQLSITPGPTPHAERRLMAVPHVRLFSRLGSSDARLPLPLPLPPAPVGPNHSPLSFHVLPSLHSPPQMFLPAAAPRTPPTGLLPDPPPALLAPASSHPPRLAPKPGARRPAGIRTPGRWPPWMSSRAAPTRAGRRWWWGPAPRAP